MIGYQLTLNAELHPDAIALAFGPRRLTYAALEERACRLANGLAALGIGPGDRVAALVHNCNAFVEALFATAKLGAIFVPVNFRLVPAELRSILEDSAPALLITEPAQGQTARTAAGEQGTPILVLSAKDSSSIPKDRRMLRYIFNIRYSPFRQ